MSEPTEETFTSGFQGESVEVFGAVVRGQRLVLLRVTGRDGETEEPRTLDVVMHQWIALDAMRELGKADEAFTIDSALGQFDSWLGGLIRGHAASEGDGG